MSVRGEITPEKLQELKGGIRDSGDLLIPEQVVVRKASKKESHLIVELKEGKNREIRRMFLSLGHEVIRLKRVSFGALSLGDLKPGEYRELSIEELDKLFPEHPVKR